MAKTGQLVEVGGRQIEVTNLDKLLWPDDGITKADLLYYIAKVSHRLLPHLAQRPLTVTRYPDGIHGKWFYQKDAPDYMPDWITTYPVASKDSEKVTDYIVANESATLVWLANQATIELNPWMSRVDTRTTPDYAVIDLDPSPGATLDDVKTVARMVKEVLDRFDLVGFPKLSGATGIHIVVPLAPKYTFQITSAFAAFIGQIIVQAAPDIATNERLIENRGQRVYIDHLQNLPGKTVVAAYSPRPLPGAPVSVPFHWDELDDIHPSMFSVKNPDQILDRPDDFDHLYEHEQCIDHLLSQFMT